MTRKKYPTGKALTDQFIESFVDNNHFKVIVIKNYCRFRYWDKEYFVYFKCITHEGNPWPIECQRAQLPNHPNFDEVIHSVIPFLFIGYDVDNDVYVCWDPLKTKYRLNKKKYVSFHSRLSIQQSIEKG